MSKKVKMESGEFKDTHCVVEDDGSETLFFCPSWHAHGVEGQSISVSRADNGMVAVTCFQMLRTTNRAKIVDFLFTKSEAEELIKAINIAKEQK